MSKCNSDTCGNVGEERCGMHHQFVSHSRRMALKWTTIARTATHHTAQNITNCKLMHNPKLNKNNTKYAQIDKQIVKHK